MIKFNKVSFRNFLSYGNDLHSYNLNTNDLTLFVGSNGSGKSVLADVIFYSLYGRPYRKIKLASLHNRVNKKNLYVSIEFSVGNDEYIIERGMKPNFFKITKNNEEQDTYNKSDQQEDFVENVLGFSEKMFRQLCILGSSYYVPFLRLSAQQRREMIERLFDLEMFETLKSNAKIYKSKTENAIIKFNADKRVLEAEIQTLDQSIINIETHNKKIISLNQEKKQLLLDEIVALRTQLKDIGDDYSTEDIEAEIADIQEKIEKLIKKELKTRQDIVDQQRTFVSDKEKLNKDINGINYKVKDVQYTINLDKNDIISMKNMMDGDANRIYLFLVGLGEKIQSLDDIINKIAVLESDRDRIKNKLDYYSCHDVCSECGSDLKDERFDQVKKGLEKELLNVVKRLDVLVNEKEDIEHLYHYRLERHIKNKSNQVENQNIEINALDVRREKLKKELDQLHKQEDMALKDNNDLIDKIENKISQLKQELKKKTILLSDQKEYVRIVEQRKSKLSMLEENLSTFQDPVLQKTDNYREEINQKREILVDIQEKLEKKERLLRLIDIMIKKVLSDLGAKSYIVKKYIPMLNKMAQQNLERFDAEYSIKFNETLDAQLYVRGEEVDYESFSGGERQRIDLTILFTFMSFIANRTNISSNFILIDEILDGSLDDIGIQSAFDILSNVSNMGKTIFLISHNNIHNEYANRVYEIKKIKGFSTVKEL